MKRTPEPELMDDAEQALAYARADFDEPNRLFVETFVEKFPGFAPGLVVDLGCGPADIPIRLVRRYRHCRVVALDGAPRMLALADAAIAEARVADRVVTSVCHFGRDAVPDALCQAADAVISNSLLHHLRDPGELWTSVRACARPGARVLVMDLLRPQSESAAREIVANYAAGEPRVLQEDFYRSLCAAYRADEIADQLGAAGLAGFDVEQISDRHLLVSGLAP